MADLAPTQDEIAELRGLQEAATPGPWQIHHDLDRYGRTEVIGNVDVEVRDSTWDASYEQAADTDCLHPRSEANAALIVAAVNALPRLLDTISSLTRERDEATRQLQEARAYYEGRIAFWQNAGAAQAAKSEQMKRALLETLRRLNAAPADVLGSDVYQGEFGEDRDVPVRDALIAQIESSLRPVASPIASAAYRCEACRATVAGGNEGRPSDYDPFDPRGSE